MTPGISLAFPWVLIALLLLLILPPGRGRILRSLALASLLLALAGPSVRGPGGELALLIDVSDSVGNRARETVSLLGQSLREDARLFHFAGESGEAGTPAAELPAELTRQYTDIARALQVAASSGAERILLISDGEQSRGDALAALPAAAVDTLWVPPRSNARVEELIVPERAAPGQTVEAVAVVTSDRPARGHLRLEVQGVQHSLIERELPAGTTAIPFSFRVEGSDDVRLRASLEVDFEQSGLDDERSAEISVAQEQPVLVIGDSALASLLRAQEFMVKEGDETDISAPLPYSAVVVRGGAGRFTRGQLEELRSFVENGGGLMMTGGPESFGFGAWYRTPVEEVLPVDSDLRTQLDIPLVALVIVLDRSQSMASGSPSKLELAKEGALGVVELAFRDDQLGMIVFSDGFEWAFRLRPATDRGKLEMLSAISAIGSGGGTILQPAFEEALAALRASEAALKHVIILSDGKLYDGQGPFGGGEAPDFPALASKAAADGITTSAIAIGRSADFELLRKIAEAGGGRYHSALDVTTLPRIFTSEALTAARSLLREGGIVPTAKAHPLSPLRGPVAPVDAYVATTPKANAEVLLTGIEREPLLAIRRHGLGRTAAFTTDLNGWAGELGEAEELPALLGTLMRWLQSRPATFAASVRDEGSEFKVVVDAVEDGRYVNGARLEARLAGNTIRLEQVAPGRYEGRLPASHEQDMVVIIQGNEVVARAPLPGGHSEFDSGSGPQLLETISRRTGGQVVRSAEEYSPELLRDDTTLVPYLGLAALLFFLAELLVRRFSNASALPKRGSSPG